MTSSLCPRSAVLGSRIAFIPTSPPDLDSGPWARPWRVPFLRRQTAPHNWTQNSGIFPAAPVRVQLQLSLRMSKRAFFFFISNCFRSHIRFAFPSLITGFSSVFLPFPARTLLRLGRRPVPPSPRWRPQRPFPSQPGRNRPSGARVCPLRTFFFFARLAASKPFPSLPGLTGPAAMGVPFRGLPLFFLCFFPFFRPIGGLGAQAQSSRCRLLLPPWPGCANPRTFFFSFLCSPNWRPQRPSPGQPRQAPVAPRTRVCHFEDFFL